MAKRKELDDQAMIEDGFFCPGPKIRRLDQFISPSNSIQHVAFNASPMEPRLSSQPIGGNGGETSIELMMDERESLPPLSSSSSDHDRSIVPYNLSDTILNFIPVQSNSSIVVSPELVHRLKNQMFPQGNNGILQDKSLVRNDSLAVVPWVPPLATQIATNFPISQLERNNQTLTEQGAMKSEQEDSSMEIETEPQEISIYSGNGGHEGFNHHCMALGAPFNSSTSIMPSR